MPNASANPDRRDDSLAKLRPALSRVAGPGQYVGGEPNQLRKDQAALRLALAFADVYSVGMSHHGLRLLYEIVNALPGLAAERVFAPFPDMEEALRGQGLRLTTLETATPLCACQVVGFSLSYELAATSVLTILDLGGIPLTRLAREKVASPLVIAGGAATMNPEPVSDFIDVFLLGEAEESLPEFLEVVREFPVAENGSGYTPPVRRELLRAVAGRVRGAYVPALYETASLPDGTVYVAGGLDAAAPFPVERRVVADLDRAPQVLRPIVPIHETVHERVVLEVMRGCPNGCRFCQAGYSTRPLRERSPEKLREAALAGLAATGYDEVGLLSLSTSNHSRFDELVESMDRELAPRGVSLSLPSLRVDHALSGIPARVKSVRKSGLTVAPEAGTDRLRAVINKDVTNDDLLAAAEEAFRLNWRQIKLYFMVGLPTETDADALAIAKLAQAVAFKRPRNAKGSGGRPAVHLSVSNFVPKPFTAFQWCGAAGPDLWASRQKLVGENVNRRMVAYHGHEVGTSLLEAVLARGDRRLGAVILTAWRKGARLDAWSEHFRPGVWNEAFREQGLDPVGLAGREFPLASRLPWEHVEAGVSRAFLAREYERALAGGRTAACGPGSCAGCGVPGCGWQK